MVTPISNGSGRVTAPPPLKPEDAFKKVDVANKGYGTAAELASAIVQLSPEGVSLAQADAQSLAKEAFTKLDADRDGKVTLGEFKAAAPRHGSHGGPPPGPPPGGGAGAPAGAQGAGAASSTQPYDPADTNQDGTVSESERLAYASQQPAAAAPTSTP